MHDTKLYYQTYVFNIQDYGEAMYYTVTLFLLQTSISFYPNNEKQLANENGSENKTPGPKSMEGQ